jgi:hypothetical protein
MRLFFIFEKGLFSGHRSRGSCEPVLLSKFMRFCKNCRSSFTSVAGVFIFEKGLLKVFENVLF